MKPQELNLDCELFEDFRYKVNLGINALIRTMIRKGLTGGKISASIGIEMKEHLTDEGEILYMPTIKPDVKIKIESKENIECEKQEGFIVKPDGANGFVVGTNQITMDELLKEKGA